MRAAAINQVVQSLSEQTVDSGNRIAAKIESVKTDHPNAEALENFLSLKILRRKVGAPSGGIDHTYRHPLFEMELKTVIFQYKLMLPATI
jgi:hypothetical protein